MLGQLVTRITITLIMVVLVAMLGVACSHPELPGAPDVPKQEIPNIPSVPDDDEEETPKSEVTPPADGATIYGRVTTNVGTPVSDVAVSDGINVTLTDDNGYYSLISDKSKGCVFISTPGNYTAGAAENRYMFWQKLTLMPSVLETHDFILYPADNNNYTVIISADQHIANRVDDLSQFRSKVVPDINETIAIERSRGNKVYSLTLGDISWEQFWTANSFGLDDALECYRDLDCNTYHTIGNHDNDPYISDDWQSSAIFRRLIGPNYYSFNIGEVHYVSLDNIIYNNPNATDSEMGERSYDRALTQDQIEWLAKDLAVLKDKSTPIVICAHVPFYSDPTISSGEAVSKRNMLNMEDLENVLKPYTNVTLFSGHYHRNYTVVSPYNPNIKEHNVASLSATLWWTARPGYSDKHLCTDGSPGGYGLLRVNGRDLDYMYKGIGCSENDQFRIYDLNTAIINESTVTSTAKYKEMVKDYAGNYYNPAKNNYVLINVYNWQPDWKIEVFEGVTPLTPQRVRVKDPLHILAYECQRLSHKAVPTATSTYTTQNSSHFFRVKASKAESSITVRVTDHKGRVYSSTVKRPLKFDLSTY